MTVNNNQCNDTTNNCQGGFLCPADVTSDFVNCIPRDCKAFTAFTCTECNTEFFLEKGACFLCYKDCTVCKSADICAICKDANFHPTNSGICQKNCTDLQNGQYCDKGVGKACAPGLTSACMCGGAKNCASCISSKCKTCLEGFKMVDGECVQCATGFYAFEQLCLDDGTGNRDKVAGGLSGGAIAGIVIAVIVVVGGIAGGLVWWALKKRQGSGYRNVKAVG